MVLWNEDEGNYTFLSHNQVVHIDLNHSIDPASGHNNNNSKEYHILYTTVKLYLFFLRNSYIYSPSLH